MKKIKNMIKSLLPAMMMVYLATGAASAKDIGTISNPIFNDTASPETSVTLFYGYHELPSEISTIIGNVPLDGNVGLLNFNIEYAINENTSLLINKLGFIDLDPDSVLNSDDGLSDISLGAKWLFYNDNDWKIAARGTVEFASGDEEVLQGNGDGNFSPALIATFYNDNYQWNNVGGLVLPFDDGEESTLFYYTSSYAYRVNEHFIPVIELNWQNVVKEGDGVASFDGQLGDVVPAIATFDGPDFFNLGSANGDENADLFTLAFGAEMPVNEQVSFSYVYEFPLTDEEESLFDARHNAAIAYSF